MMTNTKTLPGYRLALFATAFAVVVVVLGAWTRLVDAGLGCPDWPGCYGFLTVPVAAEDIRIAEARFPDSPVEVDKGWPEMIHRYFAGTLGLLVLALAVIGWRHRKSAEYPSRHAYGLLGLVILQAAFGMWTVTLKLWPQVVVAHLLGGFATLSLLLLLVLRLRRAGIEPVSDDPHALARLKRWAVAGLLVVVLQITLGGWTSANYAALACTDLPTCHGEWWPEADFAEGFDLSHEIGPNYLGGQMDHPARVAVHLTHRLGALAVIAVLLVLMVLIKKSPYNGALRLHLRLVAGLLLLQLCLGVSNILAGLPLAVAVAHNAVGAGLLLALVALNHRLAMLSPERSAREESQIGIERPAAG